MKFAIVFLTLVVAVFGASVHSGYDSRIINGHDAEPHSAKYIVSIKATQMIFFKSHICGGSIISPEWVLTAAHCITGHKLEIVAGLHDRNNEKGCQVIKVEKAIKHELYTNGVGPYDIGLLRLAKPITFTNDIQPVAVPSMDKIHSGDVTLYGWGKTSNGILPTLPNTLQTVDTHVVPYDECKAALPTSDAPIHPTNMCSGSLNSKISACSGDSGGPLTQTSEDGKCEIVGIVSWGYMPCGDENLPSIYTRVSAYTDWISEKTGMKF